MNKKTIISVNQVVWLFFILFSSFSVLQTPGLLINLAGQDSWICVIVAWILDVTFGLIYAYMSIRYYRQNYVEHSITILGKYVGGAAAMVLPVFFLITSASTQYNLNTVMTKTFLQGTPFEVLVFSSYFLTVYAVRNGIEVIGRVCEIIGPLFFCSLIILFALTAPSVDTKRMAPLVPNGIASLFPGSLFILTYLGICIMMTMFSSVCKKPEKIAKAKFIASTLGSTIIIITVICSVGVFDINLSSKLYYPTLELARIVRIGELIERIEIVWISITIGAAIISCAILLWAFSLGISQLFGLKSYKPLIYPSALLSMVLCITSFSNDIEFNNFSVYVYPFFPFVITLIEAILFFITILFKKQCANTNN